MAFQIRDTYWRLTAYVIVGGLLFIFIGLVIPWDLVCKILCAILGLAIVSLGGYLIVRRMRKEGKWG